MKTAVTYKGWRAWGPQHEIEHLCPLKKTVKAFDWNPSTDVIVCTYCACVMPKDVLQYLRNLNKLLNKVASDAP